ncbi:MAG: TatD family hydrolase [Dysgonamonadaceae bacterium]|jgi:TatD DNase family protein|nr:TatD family hydrolase [Dysgonamonadaceae bacterium]
MIDTHTHIYLDDFDVDRAEMLDRAKRVGVSKLLLPNIDANTVEKLNRICEENPDFCFPMMGLHPTSVSTNSKTDLLRIRSYLEQKKYLAIGEIGIDLYWDQTYICEQKSAFTEQLRWGIEMDLPVVIHNRNAFHEVRECLSNVDTSKLRGVFHSFAGTADEMEELLVYKNFLFGINGIVTFKNSHLPEYLDRIPIQRIVTETDAPYLSPVPFRGKRNEPAYLIHILEKLAAIYHLPPETVDNITSDNAKQLFI